MQQSIPQLCKQPIAIIHRYLDEEISLNFYVEIYLLPHLLIIF